MDVRMRARVRMVTIGVAVFAASLMVAGSVASAAPSPVVTERVVSVSPPSIQEAKARLATINAVERAAGTCCTTLADIQKCTHFDIWTRDYHTCVNWIWDSLRNLWRPGAHWVDKPTASCPIWRLDADFGIAASFVLIQRRGAQAAKQPGADHLSVTFNTTQIIDQYNGWYPDSLNPRVNSKIRTGDSSGWSTTCNKTAWKTIYN